jgi:hypothetical protein
MNGPLEPDLLSASPSGSKCAITPLRCLDLTL